MILLYMFVLGFPIFYLQRPPSPCLAGPAPSKKLCTQVTNKKSNAVISLFEITFRRNEITSFSQDGAEDGSRVACSGKTLQFFVCFICFFVVLRVRCCEYNCLR